MSASGLFNIHPLVIALSLATPALAQTALHETEETKTLKTVKIEATAIEDGSAEGGYLVEEVSQVGPWQGRRLQELPYSMSVISAALIENVQAVNSDQLFRINPTTQLRRSQHENDQTGINMRGFSAQVFYRDGVPGDQYGHGTTTEDVERIEILTGLSGFLYGPGNVGGMVNYVSKRPTSARINKVVVGNSGGNNNYVNGDFGGTIDKDGRFGYRVVTVKQAGETAVENQDIDKTFFSAAFDWHITDDLLLQINGSDRDYEVQGAQAYWGLAAGVVRPDADDIDTSIAHGQPWTLRDYENQKWGAQLRWDANENIAVRATWQDNNSVRKISGATNTIQANGTYNQSISGFYNNANNSMLSEQIDERGQSYADVHFATGDINHKLTTGVTYSHNIQERFQRNSPNINYTGLNYNQTNYRDKPTPVVMDRGARGPVSDSKTTTWSIGDDITLNEKWSLLAGIGHSTIDDAEIILIFPSAGYKKSETSPTVSLIYAPTETITTYASYIEALERGGQAAEQFNGVDVTNAGEIFSPLISEQMELGAKATIGGILLSTAIFQIDKGLQYYDISNPQLPIYVQDGRQVHKGIEVSIFGKATENLSVIGGFTLLDTKITEQKQTPALEGKRPPTVSDTFAKLHLEYQLPAFSAITLSGGINYNSDQFGDNLNTDKLPAYTLIDIGARYVTDLGNNLLTLRLDINNLTDERYWANAGYLSDPRSILLSTSVEF